MSEELQRVCSQAELLNEEDRAELAYRLIESLESKDSTDNREEWNRELNRRLATIKNQTAQGIPTDQVHQKIREIYS